MRPPYVDEIAKNLRDVPWNERQALLDDVSTHLNDAGLAPGELDAWIGRFGPPEDYARQLRSDLELEVDPRSLRRARRVRLRHIRPRSQLILGAAVAIAVVAIGGFAYARSWLDGFQPFEFDNRVSEFGARSTSVADETQYVWQWKRGGQLAVGTWLHNKTDRSIRVTEVRLPDEDFIVPWDNWRITRGSDTADFMRSGQRPVRPFTLAPGEQQLLWFRGRFDSCPGAYDGGTTTVGGVVVTFEVLGRTLTRRLDLGFSYGANLGRAFERVCKR